MHALHREEWVEKPIVRGKKNAQKDVVTFSLESIFLNLSALLPQVRAAWKGILTVPSFSIVRVARSSPHDSRGATSNFGTQWRPTQLQRKNSLSLSNSPSTFLPSLTPCHILIPDLLYPNVIPLYPLYTCHWYCGLSASCSSLRLCAFTISSTRFSSTCTARSRV